MTESDSGRHNASDIFNSYDDIKNGQAFKRIKELLDETIISKESYNPKTDYIKLFEDNSVEYQCYPQFKRQLEIFLKEVQPQVQAIHIEKQFQDIINAYNNYSFDLEQLQELSKANKATLQQNSGILGLFKIGDNNNIKKEFFARFHDLSKQILVIDGIITSFRQNHSDNVKIYFADIKQRHPELFVRGNIEDYNVLKQMDSEKIFDTKEYQMIKKLILENLMRHDNLRRTDTPEIIYRLIKRLHSNNNSKIYFLNLQKYRSRLNDAGYRKNIAILVSTYCLNIALFFDKTLFDIIDSLDMIVAKGRYNWTKYLTDIFLARSSGILYPDITVIYKIRSKIYGSDDYKLRETLFDNDDTLMSQPTARVADIKDAMSLLAGSKLKMDLSQGYMELSIILSNIISVIDTGFARMLIKSDVRHIYNFEDSESIIHISKICRNPSINYFYNDQKVWFYWFKCIDNNLREIFYLEVFLRCYMSPAYNQKFFNELLSNNIRLNSTNLIDINYDLSANCSNSEAIQSGILNKGNKIDDRKMVICTMPGADHNTAFSNTLKRMLSLPRDRFEVHVIRVKSPRHLAKVLLDISRIKKIDILLINGHGRSDRTDLGDEDLTTQELKDGVLDGLKNCFNKDSICYLVSCSTGKGNDPIAKYVSKSLGIKVYAPEEDAIIGIGMQGNELKIGMYAQGTSEDAKRAFIPEDYGKNS